MEEFTRLLRSYTVITIIMVIIISFVCGSVIAGFKVNYNITGIDHSKIGYNRDFVSENI